MSRLALVIPFFVAACGGAADAPANQPAAPTASAGAPDLQARCVELFERQRACTDVFIPALVAARVEHDKPPGVAAADATEGRDALVAKAMEEWQVDSTDEAIARTCEEILASIPPEKLDGMVAKGDECLAQAECQAFVDCIIPAISERFR